MRVTNVDSARPDDDDGQRDAATGSFMRTPVTRAATRRCQASTSVAADDAGDGAAEQPELERHTMREQRDHPCDRSRPTTAGRVDEARTHQRDQRERAR